jgi:hypothetical protein
LHTLHLPNLLLLGVSPCEVLVLVVSFPASPSSLKMNFICIFYRIFEFGGFTDSFLKEVFTSYYLVFYLLILLRFYGLHLIDIFLSFSKIPSLLKSESGCESYRIFREVIFCGFQARFDLKSNRKSLVSTGLWTGQAQPGPDMFLGWLGLVSVPGLV